MSHRITVAEELRYDTDLLPLRTLSSTYAQLRKNSIVHIGDSITANGVATTAYNSSPYRRTRGFMTWGAARLGQRLTDLGNAGVAGERSDQILTRFDTAVTAKAPGYVHILAGTNDVAQSVSAATIEANLTSMLTKAQAAGIRPIIGTIPPRTANTSAQNAVCLDVNQWIRNLAVTNKGIIVVDYWKVLVDTSGTFDSTCTSDGGTHPNSKGAARMGKVYADVLAEVPAVDPLTISALDASGALAVAQPNLYAGPLMTGTAGTTQNGGSGTVATSWNLRERDGGTTNAVASKVARTDFIAGEWQQVAAAGTGIAAIRQSITTGFSAGQVVQGFAEIQEDAGASTVTSHGLLIRGNQAGFAGITFELYDMFLDTGDTWPTEYPLTAGASLMTPSFAIPANTGIIEIFYFGNGTRTSRVSRLALRKVA